MSKKKETPSPKPRDWQPILAPDESLALLFSTYGNATAEHVFRSVADAVATVADPPLSHPAAWRECRHALLRLYNPPPPDMPTEQVEADFDRYYRDAHDAEYELAVALLAEVRKDVAELLQLQKKAHAIYLLAQAEILLLLLFNYFREKLEASRASGERDGKAGMAETPAPSSTESVETPKAIKTPGKAKPSMAKKKSTLKAKTG